MQNGNLQTKPKYIVYTDGGCSVNPGGRGGYGAVVINTDTGGVQMLSGGYKSTTNNRMEIMAAIVAFSAVPEGASVQAYADSQYLINCFTGVWRKNKNDDLFAKLDEAARGKDIQFHWVHGHAGNAYNEMCDQLATDAMFSGNLMDDAGYVEKNPVYGAALWDMPEKKPEKPKQVTVPPEVNGTISLTDRKSYSERYHVHTTCAANIIDFTLKGQRRFRDYLNLKTGGMDYWSGKTLQEMQNEIENGGEVLRIFRENLEDEKDVLSAMRWRGRGLPLSDCIRKIQVDAEMRLNVEKGKLSM